MDKKYLKASEKFFSELRRILGTGVATPELSIYAALSNLFNDIGATLNPRVFCIVNSKNQGAGFPDVYLYAERQVTSGKPLQGQKEMPDCGVVEVKELGISMNAPKVRKQVNRYWSRYHLVLLTNLRQYELVGIGSAAQRKALESYQLAESEADFLSEIEHPRAFARRVGADFGNYLARVLSHRAAIREPKDLAHLLALHAREGLERIENAANPSVLRGLRSAMQDALGISFTGNEGDHFFRSTLVQTLFYGVFSAWVLWVRSNPKHEEVFQWRNASWHLRTPVIQSLFHQISNPAQLRSLQLEDVLDWTGAALNRVDRAVFFERFNQGEAVPYFYEPFLEAFDPDLRKKLGVWYTPPEVVRYMVARVDKALREDLGITGGLAAENVYVLDPCCGTGAYLSEVLRRIETNLSNQGYGALIGEKVKKAALQRVVGFEIMPAPFVIAHLQVGLTLQDLDAALADDTEERAAVFLTNALTGWDPTDDEKQIVAFPELQEERDRANTIKRDRPILVVLGNPPYDGYADMAVGEERGLSDAYRRTRQVQRPKGQGLNNPYVRFFRVAERRITQETGQGVVCFISDYAWLDRASFTGMREHFCEVFDTIRIDCLNGDSRKTGKVAPDGSPDPSIFSTDNDPVGIQVGTAIATCIRQLDHSPVDSVGFRHLWGKTKRAELLSTAEASPGDLYQALQPSLSLGLPFTPATAGDEWFNWPALPDLFPVSFSGVKTSRDSFLVDTDLGRLEARVEDYFNAELSDDEIKRRYPRVMEPTARYNARAIRQELLVRGGPDAVRGAPDDTGFVRFAYRPFDNRWLYWERDTKLLDEKREDYRPHVFDGNLWIEARERDSKGDFSRGTLVRHLADNLGNGLSNYFPAWLHGDLDKLEGTRDRRPNLSAAAEKYVEEVGIGVEDLFHYVLAVLHDTVYREAHADGLRLGWPRIPLPGWPKGHMGDASAAFREAAERGRELARLLDPDTPVPGVTQGKLLTELAGLGVPSTIEERNMTQEDYAVTGGWGYFGTKEAVMPAQGKVRERDYTKAERVNLGEAVALLGGSTFDVFLNERAFWRNVPAAVWGYRLGGYQVIKKWLSYREQRVLGRSLTAEDIRYVSNMVRRIARLIALTANPL